MGWDLSVYFTMGLPYAMLVGITMRLRGKGATDEVV